MDVTPLGFKIGQTPFDDIGEINFESGGYSCGIGDSFVTQTPKLKIDLVDICLLYTSPSPRDGLLSRMPSSA